jgi:D-glycero-D-manno-heptose 1,7-bisphosphate phosphatase
MFPAIFLDRDGVIIENRAEYVRTWADVRFIPLTLEALTRVSHGSYKLVLVTNQAGIGKGLIAPAEAESINRRIARKIKRTGGRIDGVYLCPHKPEDGCECRKPKPGLFLQAARELTLDLSHSIAIGDKWSDLQAAQAAGIPTLVMVKTGEGAIELRRPKPTGLGEVRVYENLAEALADLLPTPEVDSSVDQRFR